MAIPRVSLSPWKWPFTSPGLGFLMCKVKKMKVPVPRAPLRSLYVSTMILSPPMQALPLKLSGYWGITFQRSAEAKLRKSLDSAESCFAPSEPHICSSLKRKKEQRGKKKKKANPWQPSFHPGSSYGADTSREIAESTVPQRWGRRQLLVGEISLARFNYESRQEAWKIPAVLQPCTGGGKAGAVLPLKGSLSSEGMEKARSPGVRRWAIEYHAQSRL